MDALRAMCVFHPSFCRCFQTLDEHYDVLSRLLPEDFLYVEAVAHDGLGLPLLVADSGELFCVHDASLVVTLRLLWVTILLVFCVCSFVVFEMVS